MVCRLISLIHSKRKREEDEKAEEKRKAKQDEHQQWEVMSYSHPTTRHLM